MTRFWIAIALSFASVYSHAQGQVNFNTHITSGPTVDARLFTLNGTPATTMLEGLPIFGQLAIVIDKNGVYSPLSPIGTFATNVDEAGYINVGPATALGFPSGTRVTLVLRAWAGGSSRDLAIVWGQSKPIEITLGQAPDTLPNLIGLQPFTIGPDGGGFRDVARLDLVKLSGMVAPGQTIKLGVNLTPPPDRPPPFSIPFDLKSISFDLNYPTNALRLRSRDSIHSGSIVPLSADVEVTVKPEGIYLEQIGSISFFATNSTPWPTNSGSIAEFDFEVQPGITNDYLALIRLLNMFSSFEFSNQTSDIYLQSREPHPPQISLTDTQIIITVEGPVYSTWRFDQSRDLINWANEYYAQSFAPSLSVTFPRYPLDPLYPPHPPSFFIRVQRL